MEHEASVSEGYLSSLRSLGDNLLGSLQDRLELFTTELQEEKFRLVQTSMWISAALFAGMLAITFASLTLVYLFWDSARIGVLFGLTVFYSAALTFVIIAFRRYLGRQPKPFAATLQEIGKDRECIRHES
jgi:uncharacterized membrane protein YqjE